MSYSLENLEAKLESHIELLRKIYESQGESEFYYAVLWGCVADVSRALEAIAPATPTIPEALESHQ